jgi:hypothetical protein
MASNVPRPEAVRALVESKDLGRVVMLNLLKFKPVGGVASYTENAMQVRPILERLGANLIFAGPDTSTVIGEQTCDSILLI